MSIVIYSRFLLFSKHQAKNKSNLDFDKEVTFNFTKKNDPHVLYDKATFKIGDNTQKKVSIQDSYSVFTDSQVADCVYTEVK